jgi:hypothetical protein
VVRCWLPDPKSFKFFAGLVLLYIGLRMARDLLLKGGATGRAGAEERFRELARAHRARREQGEELPGVRVLAVSSARIRYEFYGERYGFSPSAVGLMLCGGHGGRSYGIGGGASAPFWSLFGLRSTPWPAPRVVGNLLTSAAGGLLWALRRVSELRGAGLGLGFSSAWGAWSACTGRALQKWCARQSLDVAASSLHCGR